MSRGSITSILHPPGRPSGSMSGSSPLLSGCPSRPQQRWSPLPHGQEPAGPAAPRHHQQAGSQASSTLNFSKGFTYCFLLKVCLQGLNVKWEGLISCFFQFLASLYSGLNSCQAMNNKSETMCFADIFMSEFHIASDKVSEDLKS